MSDVTIARETTATVVSGLQAYLPGYKARVTLEWAIREPYAIAFAVEQPGDITVTYRVDRRLLWDSAMAPGVHDHVMVRVATLGRDVMVTWLGEYETRLRFERDELVRFLTMTWQACPPEAEDIDVDGLIAQILEESA